MVVTSSSMEPADLVNASPEDFSACQPRRNPLFRQTASLYSSDGGIVIQMSGVWQINVIRRKVARGGEERMGGAARQAIWSLSLLPLLVLSITHVNRTSQTNSSA